MPFLIQSPMYHGVFTGILEGQRVYQSLAVHPTTQAQWLARLVAGPDQIYFALIVAETQQGQMEGLILIDEVNEDYAVTNSIIHLTEYFRAIWKELGNEYCPSEDA